MTHKIRTIGWRKFKSGKARHHWRTRSHMGKCYSACSLSYPEGELRIAPDLPACPECEMWLSVYVIYDPPPPQK